MSTLTKPAARTAPPVLRPPTGEAVSPAERERRLFFIAEKMLEGMSRSALVTMGMECFGVGKRAAQKYVAAVERRLRNSAVHESPLFYLQLTKSQRDKLLESVLRRTAQTDRLESKELADLVSIANKVLDSRDRAAVLMFQWRNGEQNAPACIQQEVTTVRARAELLRSRAAPLQIESDSTSAEPESPAADNAVLAEEVRTLLLAKMADGLSPEEAANALCAEVREGKIDANAMPGNELQPEK